MGYFMSQKYCKCQEKRSLESINNPRLERLKEKTLGWRFGLVHIPEKKLCGL